MMNKLIEILLGGIIYDLIKRAFVDFCVYSGLSSFAGAALIVSFITGPAGGPYIYLEEFRPIYKTDYKFDSNYVIMSEATLIRKGVRSATECRMQIETPGLLQEIGRIQPNRAANDLSQFFEINAKVTPVRFAHSVSDSVFDGRTPLKGNLRTLCLENSTRIFPFDLGDVLRSVPSQ